MYKVDISPDAKKHLEVHKKSGQEIVMKRIDRIFKELKLHPESGIGKPKKLKNDPQERWSRRIDKKKRMTYQINENEVIVLVISAKGHYDDK